MRNCIKNAWNNCKYLKVIQLGRLYLALRVAKSINFPSDMMCFRPTIHELPTTVGPEYFSDGGEWESCLKIHIYAGSKRRGAIFHSSLVPY